MKKSELGFVERVSYGFGDMGTSLAYNMASGFLLFYYTNIIGLPAAAVGTVFLVARLMDAVIDVLVGIAVDKTRTRWGRTRVYFLVTAIPYALLTVAVFSMPTWSQGAQLVYAFVTFKALGIVMSLQAIPYTALMPMMTLDGKERLRLSGLRSIGTATGVVLGTAAVMPLVGVLGGGDQRRGFTLVAMLFAVVGLLCTLALFRNCKERYEDDAQPGFAILPAIGEMVRNRAWLVVFFHCLLYFARFGMMMAATAYFAIDVMGRPWMISVMLPAVAGMLLLSAFVAPAILARTGLRNGTAAALAIAALFFGALPFVQDHVPLFLGLYVAGCLATSITITSTYAMIAETVNYHEARFGARREGLLSAGISLSTKLGMALGTAGFAYVLGAFHYAPGHVTAEAREAIRWTYSGGAVAVLIIQTLVVLCWPRIARPRP
ncbi:MFS transporter [Sphingomonas sp. SORGH_AS_0879]|uniref:MFS transporter n=1 Tax=Sphingomonas sp. SORGH_AS_0879 TaxID=3041790 RepID=UPI00277DC235|nr:glycoside-pentoside-hexuronide (GPH):cation symporter [Sphingomonas sp. SORGH_AS_0879]MDQ1231802.1 sugar (glycoside-pentoside-hexuronide) transporter [Sphingomonas sp. SORGH_AS_0879]